MRLTMFSHKFPHKRHRCMTISRLVCCECGQIMFVPRPHSCQRSAGHIKHLFCPSCRKKRAHVEIRQYDIEQPIGFYIRRPFFHEKLMEAGLRIWTTAMYKTDDGRETAQIYCEQESTGGYAFYDIFTERWEQKSNISGKTLDFMRDLIVKNRDIIMRIIKRPVHDNNKIEKCAG